MEKEQALSIIEQALNITIGKGVFKPEESATIFTALINIKNLLNEPEAKQVEKIVKEEVVKTPIKKIK
jgi:hypothetical protein